MLTMDESPKRGLLAAYARLLGPLIRILIRNGVTFDEFSKIAKQTYVEVAAKDFRVRETTSSEPRLSILTGLEETEVREINESFKSSSEEKTNTLDGIVRVLAAWHTDSNFTGPYGLPIELKFEDQSSINFARLAKENFSSFDPKELLNKLIKVGLVTETEQGWFKVLARNYRPEGSAPDGLEHLARTLSDMVNTLDHNSLEDNASKRLFERQVYTEDGIRAEDLPRFQAFASSKASVLLDEIDNWLTQLDKPNEMEKRTLITGMGIFNYVQQDKDQP